LRAIGYEHNDRRIDARKNSEAAGIVTADSGIAAGLGLRWRAAMAAVFLHAVPDNKRPGVGGQVCLVRWQDATEVTQVVEFAEIGQWLLFGGIDGKRECRVITKIAEKNRLAPFEPWRSSLTVQQQCS
jgi:hypothetical protein